MFQLGDTVELKLRDSSVHDREGDLHGVGEIRYAVDWSNVNLMMQGETLPESVLMELERRQSRT